MLFRSLFICASEHEGYCVPLVEAFYKGVPVLAYAATAVPATMDGAGVLFTDKDPADVAELMHAIVSDDILNDAIVADQLAAVERLQAHDFDHTLLGFVERILAAPRRGHARVRSDFWQQFDDHAALETIRRTRPAAFKALPEAHA